MYQFKPGPELIWAVIVTISGVLTLAVATQGELPPNDLKSWMIAVGLGVLRALLGLILSFTGPKSGDPV